MPAKTEKQRKFMGAELERKREGKQTKTDMSEAELEKMASKTGRADPMGAFRGHANLRPRRPLGGRIARWYAARDAAR